MNRRGLRHVEDRRAIGFAIAHVALVGGTIALVQDGAARAWFVLTAAVLACSSFHARGKTVCANSMECRLEDADSAVLRALEVPSR